MSLLGQTPNYFGTSGTLNASVWSTNPAGPYTSPLNTAGGAVINFNNPASVAGASITVAGINASANVSFTSVNGTISNAGNGVIPITVNPGVTLDFGSQAFTSAGGGGYRKEGDGVVAMAGGNYGGGFTLNAGTVIARGVNAFGSAGELTINGGTIAANSNRDFQNKFPDGIFIGGDFTLGATTGLASPTANLTFSNSVALGATTRKITIGGNGTYTFAGSVTGSAGLMIDATAGGTLALSGANTYAGPTTIQSGIVRFTQAAALYNGVVANWLPGSLIVHAQATAVFQAGGIGEFTASNVADILLGTGFQGSSSIALDTTNAAAGKFVQSAALAEPTAQLVNLVKEGFGTLALATGNAYSGQTIIRAGTLQIGDGADAGDLGASSAVLNSATLRIQRAGEFMMPQAISGSGALVHSGPGSTTLTAAHSYTGTTAVTGGTLSFGSSASHANGGSLTVSGAAGATFQAQTTGTLVFNTGISIGNAGQSGAVLHSAGNVSLANTTNYLAIGAGGYGSYTLEGGQLSIAGTTGARIGATAETGQGVFVQTGGSMDTHRSLSIGHGGGTGVATFLGGTFTTSTSYGILVGEGGSGSGTMNLGTLAGGTATVISQAITSAPGLTIGSAAPGTLNLNSGTLRILASGIRKGTAAASLNLNGATIQAAAPSLTLIDSSVPATIFRGGVVIDTQANNSTVAASLMAAAGHGIYPASGGFSLAAGAGYIGAPIVTISGGSGSGAMAIAEVTNGVVTAIRITSPGQNYLAGDTLTFHFAGGGAATAADSFQRVLAAGDVQANATGGLTKESAGTLNLTGASNYTGETRVNAGTLLVSGSLSGSIARVANGATLGGSGVIRGAILESGARLAPGNGPGTLTISDSLELDSGSIVNLQLSGTNQVAGSGINDLIIAGALTLDGTLNVAEIIAGSFLSAGYGSRWRVMNYDAGELTDEGLALGTRPNLAAGLSFTIDTSIAGQVDLLIVPEPSSVLVALTGAATLASRRRRIELHLEAVEDDSHSSEQEETVGTCV